MGLSTSLPASLRFIERDWLSSNHLLARGAGDNVLIDTGYCTRRDLTLELVGRALSGEPLHRIINTHTHSDHVGGNAALKTRYDCRITIPAGIREAVRLWQEDRLMYSTMGQTCDRFVADDDYSAGDTIAFGDFDWQAIGSPGHDMDSLLLYQPDQRILISSDALWENGFGVVFPEFFDEPGFESQAATLELLSALDIDIVLPGHGRLFTDAAGAIGRARERLAYFRTNPDRHAELALTVALSFMLLDRQRISLKNLETSYGRLALVMRINDKYFGKDISTLTREAVERLRARRVARIEDGYLVPAEA